MRKSRQFYLGGLLTVWLAGIFAFGARADFKVVAYVPNWINLNSFSTNIDYSKLTHINIAFENPVNDDGDLSFHPADDVLIQQARAHQVKILVSLGGGSASNDKVLLARYLHLMNDTNRPAFVAKLGSYVTAHHFDGLDVDLEGPGINPFYGAFVAELGRELKTRGKLMTAALSQGYGGKSVPDSALADLDFVNIMAYDGTGTWNPNAPGQHSSYAFATNNVAYWRNRGLPKSKAVLGVPFYGYGFGPAFRKRDYSYASILAEFPDAQNLDQVGNTIWYNGIPTITAKSHFVKTNELTGVMIWSLDYDVTGEASLLSAIDRALQGK